MKNKKYLLVIVLSIYVSTFLLAQTSIKKYYNLINKAELSICDSAIMDAAKYYKKAFKYKKYPFVKDYYNAFICAAMTNDKKAICEYYIGLKQLDYETERSLKTKTQAFISEADWRALVDIPVDLVIDTIYKKKLDDLVELDQAIRQWASTKGLPGYYATNADTIQHIDSITLKELKDAIINYGFPSEDKVGTNQSLLGNNNYFIIILHNQMWRRLLGGDVLKDAVLKGHLNAEKYAQLYEYMINNFKLNLYGDTVISVDERYYSPIGFTLNEENLLLEYPINEEAINRFRAKIYLSPLEDARRKITYQYNSRAHTIFIFSQLDVYYVEEEIAKGITQKMRNVEKKYKEKNTKKKIW